MKTKNNAMKNISRGLASALALTLVFVSCEQISEDINPAGMISFGAAASYVNAPETKTEYSGKDQNDAVISSTSQFERIDWVKDYDIIKILCGQTKNEDGSAANTSGTYKITAVPTADGKVSKESAAGVTPVDGTTPFFWGTGDHYFYALYPAAGTTSNYHSGTVTDSDSKIELLDADGTTAKITGSVPAAQSVVLKSGTRIYKPNMNRAYMYAAKKTAPTTSTVTLDFYPLVTAFEFYLKALDDGMASAELTTLTLTSTSTDMTGGFTATLDVDATAPATITKASSGLGREITVTFPAGTKLNKDEYTDVTVLALGVAQTDLKLTLAFADNTTRSIDLVKSSDGSAVSVGACKKVYMRLGVPDSPIFEVTPVVTFDWQGNQVVPDPTVAASVTSETIHGEVLPWTIEGYYTEIDADGKVVPSSRIPDDQLVGGIPAWLASLNNGNPGGPGTQPFPIECPEQDPVVSEELTAEAIAENNKVNVAAKGTAASPWNVSNPTGGATIVESANCYIVNGPGYYRLPLVMGNGVKNDALNPDAKTYMGYDGKLADGGVKYKEDWRALFQDYKGNNITNPYLHKSSTGVGVPTSADIIWEDIEGLIETDLEYNLPASSITYDSGKDCYWLNFHVTSERTGRDIATTTNVSTADGGTSGPRQGNAVIAIKDADGTIMWNYHIWLTDYKADNDIDVTYYYRIESDAEGGYPAFNIGVSEDVIIPYEIMGKDVGFTIYGRTVTRTWDPNTVYVNFVQTGTNATDVMQIIQTDNTESTTVDRGRPTFQYGRTFAVWPDGGLNTNEIKWYGKVPVFTKETITSAAGAQTQAQSIQKAGIFFARNSAADFSTPILATINVEAPEKWTFDNVNWGSKWTGDAAPEVSYPTNFWDADERFILGSSSWVVWGLQVDHSDRHIIRKVYGSPHPSSMTMGNKTILDPNPAGYVMPGFNICMILRTMASNPDPFTEYYNYRVFRRLLMGTIDGNARYRGLIGNNYEFYTSYDKDPAKIMYVPKGYARRDNAGALQYGWSVATSVAYRFRNGGSNYIHSYFAYTRSDEIESNGQNSFPYGPGSHISSASRPLREDSNQYWNLFPYISKDHWVEFTDINTTITGRPNDDDEFYAPNH